MYMLLMVGSVVWLVTVLLMMISFGLGAKFSVEREASSPFECGFDPSNYNRSEFSIRFFLVAVIFLIFDIEIALLFPLMILNFTSTSQVWAILSLGFPLLLLLGTYFEWKEGALDWKV